MTSILHRHEQPVVNKLVLTAAVSPESLRDDMDRFMSAQDKTGLDGVAHLATLSAISERATVPITAETKQRARDYLAIYIEAARHSASLPKQKRRR